MKIDEFKTDMFVICKPETPTESGKNFHIYARVIAIDNTNRRILLDKYMEEGRLHCIGKGNGDRWNDFDEEYAGYYSPMTNEEIMAFRKGIKELMDARKRYPREDMNVVEATYDKLQDRINSIRAEKREEIDKRQSLLYIKEDMER